MRDAWEVFRKELRETLRDRRTLLMMVVVPILLYPALLIVSEQLALFGERQLGASSARVGIEGNPPAELLRFLEGAPDLEIVEIGSAEQALRRDSVQAVASFREVGQEDGNLEVTVLFDAADERSSRGRALLVGDLAAWSDTLLARRLRARGLSSAFIRPMEVADSSVARPEDVGGYALGRFLPMLLIVITLLGTFYPAIDLAAGEKERGTLETLLTAPVPAERIVAGKFLTVAVVGLVAAGLNLASMLLSFQTGLFQFGGVVDAQFRIPLRAILAIFVTLVPLAILFGALFLGVAVQARSFKEAQNALTPVYMLALVPAILPLFPGIDLTPFLAVAPVAGVALFFRDVMSGGVTPALGFLAITSTVAYALLSLRFAAMAFGREDVLFGGDEDRPAAGASRGGVFARLAGPRGPVPTWGQAVGFLTVLVVLFFYLGRTLQIRLGETGILLSEWGLLLGAAASFTALGRFDVRRTMSLKMPAPGHLAAAILVIAGGTPLAWFIAWAQSFVLPIPYEFLEGVTDLLVTDDPLRILWLVFLIAVTPAICEEAVFRGVFLAGSRQRLSPLAAVLVNAAVFGAFHLSFETAFRFLPTAWLGLLLATVVWRTRSIFAGALMHFLNNATIVLIGSSQGLQERLGGADQGPPLLLLPLAVASLALGLHILLRATESNPEYPS